MCVELKAEEHIMLTKVHTFRFCLFHAGRCLLLNLSFLRSQEANHLSTSLSSPRLSFRVPPPPLRLRNFARMTDFPAASDVTKVTVFNLENKLVAYSGTEIGRSSVSGEGFSYCRMGFSSNFDISIFPDST